MKSNLLSHKADRMRENVLLQVKPDGSKSTSFSWNKTVVSTPTIFGSDSKFTAKASFLHPGFNKCWIPNTTFCTCSSYEGEWNGIGMYGVGEYYFPHKVEYEGNLRDGMFHGEGTLMYPMGQKVEGEWSLGRLITFKYKFADGLEYDIPWKYCIMPDRRFYTSIQDGLKPAGRSRVTNRDPPRKIPEGCYDTEDGFYNPATKCVMSAITPNKVIRIPTAKEEKWIMDNCRKAWDEPTGYRPDLYEHWVIGRSTDSVFNESTSEEEVNNNSSSSSESWHDSQTSVKIIVSPASAGSPESSSLGW